jgi:hypothetical protein
MCKKGGIEEKVAIDHREFDLIYRGIRHRINSFGQSASHRNQFRLCEEIDILLAAKDGKLIPEEGNQCQGGAQNHLAGEKMLLDVYPNSYSTVSPIVRLRIAVTVGELAPTCAPCSEHGHHRDEEDERSDRSM